jgi:hypothetical protein
MVESHEADFAIEKLNGFRQRWNIADRNEARPVEKKVQARS